MFSIGFSESVLQELADLRLTLRTFALHPTLLTVTLLK
jgi:hypothetical protein